MLLPNPTPLPRGSCNTGLPWTRRLPLRLTSPATSNGYAGVVPIPTPVEVTVSLLLPPAATLTVPAPEEYSPDVLSPAKVSEGAAAVPAPSASELGGA